MQTDFTPLTSLAGGLLIGLSAVLLMLLLGRVLGATGILAGVLRPAGTEDWRIRAALLLGMVSAPLALRLATGAGPEIAVAAGPAALVAGGLLVGAGTALAGGCTSGHGICGVARLSPRSLAATASFMLAGFATVYVLRHLAGGA